MKQVMLIIGLMFTFAVANAQVANTPTTEKPTNQQKAHNQAMQMQKALALSPDQTVKVEAVVLSRIEAVTAIKNDGTKSPEVQKKEIEEVRNAKEKELSTIFTPEQYSLYLQKKAERQARAAGAH